MNIILIKQLIFITTIPITFRCLAARFITLSFDSLKHCLFINTSLTF